MTGILIELKSQRGVRFQLDILCHQVTPPLTGMGYNLLKGPVVKPPLSQASAKTMGLSTQSDLKD